MVGLRDLNSDPFAAYMDIAGAVSFLQLRKQAAEEILSKLTAAISELPELDVEEATTRVQTESNASIDFAINELEAWKGFLEEVLNEV